MPKPNFLHLTNFEDNRNLRMIQALEHKDVKGVFLFFASKPAEEDETAVENFIMPPGLSPEDGKAFAQDFINLFKKYRKLGLQL